jgi:hypothetical protein
MGSSSISANLTVSTRGTGSGPSLGQMEEFVRRAQEAGMTDQALVRINSYSDQRDSSSGWSMTASEEA